MTDILITEDCESPCVRALAERYSLVVDPALWKDSERLRAELARARSIMIRNQTRMTRPLLDNAPHLLAIGRVGVGLDNIDVDAASAHGIVIISPLGTNATSVAELTLGFILALARKIPVADRLTKAGRWDRRPCAGLELDGKILGLCGLGRIGSAVALRARAFGMRVLAFDPWVRADTPAIRETGVTLVAQLEELLAQADFVSVHLPLTPATRHWFDERRIAAIKPGAFFINTSRGGVVNELALLAALRDRRLAGAALDVRETEPPASPIGFEEMDNVILTPHIGALTHEAQTRTLGAVCADLDRVLSGHPVVNFVNFALPARPAATG
jgi:D-3-phosphoglycerate dehydrogenase